MAREVPVLGGKFDPSDPEGTVKSGAMTVFALMFGGIIVAVAAWMYNRVASATPDSIPEVTIA